MKITSNQLRRIIKEELSRLTEGVADPDTIEDYLTGHGFTQFVDYQIRGDGISEDYYIETLGEDDEPFDVIAAVLDSGYPDSPIPPNYNIIDDEDERTIRWVARSSSGGTELSHEDAERLKILMDDAIADALSDDAGYHSVDIQMAEIEASGFGKWGRDLAKALGYSDVEDMSPYMDSDDYGKPWDAWHAGISAADYAKSSAEGRLQREPSYSKTKARARERGPASQEMEDEIEARMWRHGAKPTVVSEV